MMIAGGFFRGESGYLVRGNAPFTINLVRSGWCRWTASIHSIRGAAAAQGSTIRHATCCSHWTSNRPTLPPGCMWTGPRKRSAQVTRLAHLNPRGGEGRMKGKAFCFPPSVPAPPGAFSFDVCTVCSYFFFFLFFLLNLLESFAALLINFVRTLFSCLVCDSTCCVLLGDLIMHVSHYLLGTGIGKIIRSYSNLLPWKKDWNWW